MTLTRRHFLQALSVSGAAAALGGLDALGTRTAAAGAPVATPGVGTLVLVTLYGGNDALNTVVPVEDGTYRSARGDLALDPAATHPLGEGWALHPALPGCKGLWDRQQLAVVHGVGFGNLDRSHFHCMDVWQAGSEDDQSTGWLGRWLDLTGGDPLVAVAVGRELPLALRGATRSAAVVPVGPFRLPASPTLRRQIATMSVDDNGRPVLGALVAATTADLLDVVDTMGPLLEGQATTDDLADDADAATGRRTGGLGGQLDVVAASIEAGIPARVYSVALGGFDTHANQAGTHEALLAELDVALSRFVPRMGERPVTVLVYSEFGRRVTPNGSGGTDHGSAGTVLLAGTVRPGFHGEPSPLDQLTEGDLVTTVDFRSVYGGVLEGVLGFEAADLFPGGPTPLALV